MYTKPLEIEEEFTCHDWIDNFKGHPQPVTLRILYMTVLYNMALINDCVE